MSTPKINKTCYFCKTKVNKFDSKSIGHMEVYHRLFHYSCIRQYGYQKFCMEVINSEENKLSDEEIMANLSEKHHNEKD